MTPPSGSSPGLRAAAGLARPFVGHVLSATGARFWASVALMAVSSLSSGAMIVLLIPLVQAVGAEAPADSSPLFRWVVSYTDSAPGLAGVLALLVAVVAVQGGVRWWDARLQTDIVHDVMFALRERLFRGIAYSDWTTFTSRRSADLLETITRHVERVGHAAHDLLGLCAAAFTTFVYVGLAMMVSPAVTSMVLGLGGLLMLALAHRRRAAHEAGSALTSQERRLYRLVQDALSGMKLVRSHGLESRQVQHLDDGAQSLRGVHRSLASNPALVRLWFDTGSAVILSLAAFVALRGPQLAVAELFVLIVLFARLAPSLSVLQVYFQMLVAELPAFDAVMQTSADLGGGVRSRVAAADGVPVGSGAVRLDHVTYQYDRQPVLTDVTLEIPAGRTVAIVGESGGGKTTIADLILGLLRPDAGRVVVDGSELDDAVGAKWRHAVGYVQQDAFLFHESIRDNLRWSAPRATDAEMEDALRAASAGFVQDLPQGLGTIVGDRGVLLSAGERQRIALARALLRKPALLVLDEATSALDSENEQAIQRAIAALHGRVTILIIAHRLSTVRDVDCIYVLENGRIAEAGTWAELVGRPDGRLTAMATAQGIAPAGRPEHTIAGETGSADDLIGSGQQGRGDRHG